MDSIKTKILTESEKYLQSEEKNTVEELKGFKKIIDDSKPFYQSKKFWFTVVSALVPVANKVFDIGLNTEEIATLLAPLIAYVATLAYKESKNA